MKGRNYERIFYLMYYVQVIFKFKRRIQGYWASPIIELRIRQAKKAKEYFEDISLN